MTAISTEQLVTEMSPRAKTGDESWTWTQVRWENESPGSGDLFVGVESVNVERVVVLAERADQRLREQLVEQNYWFAGDAPSCEVWVKAG